jgi:hypothetical protein
LLRLENQQKASTDAHLKEELRANIRNTNIERMKQGQQPIILNKRKRWQTILPISNNTACIILEKFEARLKDAKNTQDNSSSSRGAVNMKSGNS